MKAMLDSDDEKRVINLVISLDCILIFHTCDCISYCQLQTTISSVR